MTVPHEFLEELRARLAVSEVVARLGVVLKRAGREFSGCCPFHHEKNPSFTVNDAKGFFHCFGCGAHGDVIGFTMRYGRSFPEAAEELAGMAVPEVAPAERARAEQRRTGLALVVAYDPEATAPVWSHYLETALPDPEVRAFLQVWSSYAFTGLNTEQMILLLTGEGSSGKSIFIETLEQLAGSYTMRLSVFARVGT